MIKKTCYEKCKLNNKIIFIWEVFINGTEINATMKFP
jgi:hypothetical protein